MPLLTPLPRGLARPPSSPPWRVPSPPAAVDKTKEEATASQKKERKLEEQLKATSQSIQRMQFKSTFAVTIVMAFMLATLSTVYVGAPGL